MDKSAVAIDRVTLSSFRFFFWMQESFLVLPQFDITNTLCKKDLKQDMEIATVKMYSRAILLLEIENVLGTAWTWRGTPAPR